MKSAMWVRGTILALTWLAIFGIRAETIHAEPVRETDAKTSLIRDKARLYTRWLYSGRYGLLWANGSQILKNTYGNLETFKMIMKAKMPDTGTNGKREADVWNERVRRIDTSFFYEREVMFKDVEGHWSVEWGMDSRLRIQYMEVRLLPPEAHNDYLDYRSKTSLRLPFDGKWTVLWGGRSIQENYHADTPKQRFACDFFAFRNGYYYRGDGTSNEDYYSFNRPILAPGSGVVIEAVDGVPDNLAAPLGNHVVLDHRKSSNTNSDVVSGAVIKTELSVNRRRIYRH